MAGRILSVRFFRSLRTLPLYPPTYPLRASSALLSHPFLADLLSSRFFSGRSSPNTARKEKSLIEDEAELSDWISDLKTDSRRFPLNSDSEEDSDRRSGRVTGKFKEREKFRGEDDSDRRSGRATGKFREREKFRGEDDSDRRSGRATGKFREREKFRGEDDSDRRSGRVTGKFKERENFRGEDRNSKGPRGSAKTNRGFSSGEDDDDEGGYGEGFSPRRERGAHGGGRMSVARKGSGGKGLGGRSVGGRKDLDFVFSGEERGSRSAGFSSRKKDGAGRSERLGGGQMGQGGRGLNFNLAEEETEDESDEGFPSGKEGSGKTGRGGKDMDFDLSKEESESDSDEEFSDFEEDLIQEKKDTMKEGLSGGDSGSDLRSEKSDEGERDESTVRGSVGENDSYLSQKRFDEFSISQLTLKGVKSAGYERMTIVQEATLPVILKGKDVLAKARTGTGKTVAFLLPAIELVAGLPPVDRDERRPPINVLVVCPTRELADQAAQEAIKLVKYHTSMGVQLVIGGTRLATEQKRMQTNPCQILVATPGRLRDHIENTPGFATRLRGVKVLVLDEADRLLDMGFRKDIEKIVDALPKQRQTLLFSATVPDEVRQICYVAMKRDLEFINTVIEGSEETHSQVKQMHVVAPLEKQFPILYGLLNDHILENVDYKVIVFCTTAMATKLVAEYLAELKLNVREIHSRKPQSYRTRVSKEFRESKGLILVSSDVSARGVDYPNLGVPADRDQYIHRVGRTGRKGREGTGIIILAPWEGFFLRSIQDLPITEAPLPLIDPDMKKKVARALAHVEVKDKESAYQAWLGYYNSNKNVGRDKYQLVSLANEFSRSIGLDNPPALPRQVLSKMGLNNIPGLRSR
ncbi:DEAD-box ATP-dependent RNA helicase 31-like protein [Carex littledalei]|uniref:ATP-dependent RNA helicase n=1 Tax=Carex littledalei TaxID=544730 RepID=A0A833VB21_9POAL|nr:DEAD-box ATP-dependent RNA helicase 31-like protein [Carex littledalei]